MIADWLCDSTTLDDVRSDTVNDAAHVDQSGEVLNLKTEAGRNVFYLEKLRVGGAFTP